MLFIIFIVSLFKSEHSSFTAIGHHSFLAAEQRYVFSLRPS